MYFNKLKSIILACSIMCIGADAHALVWYDGENPVRVGTDTKTDLVVGTAMKMFASDMDAVTGKAAEIVKPSKAGIVLTQLDRASGSQLSRLRKIGVPVDSVSTLIDGFNITVANGRIYVSGANGRGTAYGLLELSRSAGVSPWIWWGDVAPERKDTLSLPDGYTATQGASVERRGIFINDEDWSIRPWSGNTLDPGTTGTISPRAYKEVFKLLMRLRANALWPAMHPGTEAFFKNPVNKLIADSCGIAVGSSHCEPLLRNNVDEWDEQTRGRFNYITNRPQVQSYWIERLKEVSNSEGGNMFTIGMRGIHDGSMEGVKTNEEKFSALQQVIDDQQALISQYIGDPSDQMQVFVPYKEVLELYEQGLNVPNYVTLMWCDDNYGYITRLSTPQEQEREGGAGVYYHLSYWGRPHDHLWLTTTQPGLLYSEMRNAYDHNVRKLWIANVHDPKVAAYDLELFMDMAWDIDGVNPESLGSHLKEWLATNFGEAVAEKVYPAMRKHYELSGKRRPEFMGWSQVELSKQTFNRGLSPVANTEFSFTEFGDEADRYMDEYMAAARTVAEAESLVPERLKDAYFAAVKYPVTAAANHAVKMLEAQRARSLASGGTPKDVAAHEANISRAVAKSQRAYQNVRDLTRYYNEGMASGKWRGSMNMRPRDLPVYGAPSLPVLLTDAEVDRWLADMPQSAAHSVNADGVVAQRGEAFVESAGEHTVIDMLGHSGRAVELKAGSQLTYKFTLNEAMPSPKLTTAVIPTQPNDGGRVRYSVSVDGCEPVEYDLKEPFRSEQWKLNVLRGQALRSQMLADMQPGEHTLTITAIDPHIIVDQWILDPKKDRRYYLIPSE